MHACTSLWSLHSFNWFYLISSSLMHCKHTTETSSFMHEVKCLIDLRKSQTVGDVLINLDFLQNDSVKLIYFVHKTNHAFSLSYFHLSLMQALVQNLYLLHVLFYKPRHLWSALEATKCCSLPYTPSHQLERSSTYFLTWCCNPHNNWCPPTLQFFNNLKLRSLNLLTNLFYVLLSAINVQLTLLTLDVLILSLISVW